MGFLPETELAAVESTRTTRCLSCGLFRQCNSPKMLPTGEGRRKLLIIAEAPGRDEDEQGIQLVGKAGKRLRGVMKSLGWDLDRDCWKTNAVCCRPQENRMTDAYIENCRPNLLKHVKRLDPEVILLLGGSAVKSFLGSYWRKDIGPITRWVGWQIPLRVSPEKSVWVCISYHPSYLERMEDPVLDLWFEKHLEDAFALEGRPKVKPYPPVEIIISPDDAASYIRANFFNGKPISFDFETDRLKPDDPKSMIVGCSVCWAGKKVIAFPWWGEAVNAMRELLRSTVPKYGYNCFSGDTKFLTKEYGVISFQKVVGKTVTVLNHEGKWTKGKVFSAGIQETVETSFVRRNYVNTIRSTWDHEWISSDGGDRIKTSDLRRCVSGCRADRIPYIRAPKVIDNQYDYMMGIRHGIILGDGSCRTDRPNTFTLRLCGEKASLLKYFDGFPVSYPPSYGGDPHVHLSKQTIDFKELPSDSSSDSYLIGFLRGLLATDGSVSSSGGQVAITNDKKVIEWCVTVLPKVGYWFQGKHSCLKYAGKYENTYNLQKDVWTAYFSRECVSTDDFLKESHALKYKQVFLGPYKFSGWGEVREEEVFCVRVPEGHSFTLDGGLVTGNCKFEQRWVMARLGYRVNNWAWDGMQGAHVLDNRRGITSLKFQGFVQFGMPPWDLEVGPYLEASGGNEKNRIHRCDLSRLLYYCGVDSLVEYRVAVKQMKAMRRLADADA